MGELVCESLGKLYGGKTKALDSVSFSVPSSGIFALIGRNGAGKTTLVRILATELELTSGRASIDGIDVMRQEKVLRERIAIVPQEARTVSWMTPVQTVLAYLLWRGFGYSEARKRASETLSKLGLEKNAHTMNHDLSGGTKRKVLAATALASEAEIVFLDEPTTGLDPISRKEFWEILRVFAKDRFIFLTTHYLEEAEEVADNIGILGQGKLVAAGSLQSIRDRMKYPYSIKLPSGATLPSKVTGEVIVGKRGETQVLTNEDEAFAISRRLSEGGQRFSISPVTLDDIFFQLVGETARDDEGD